MGSKQRNANADDGDTQVLSDDPDVLREQLQEKEQLVAALTNRLEQAAEQLDRLHRTGGDRGVRISGMPPELLEQQKGLMDGLQQAVQSWEEMQCAESLGRIEAKVTELREMVAERLTNFRAIDPAALSGAASAAAAPPPPKSGGGTDAGSSWAAMKASLMGEPPPEEKPAQSAAPQQSAAPALDLGAEEDIPLGDAPQPIDLDAATIDDLRRAVDIRDAYIVAMARKLRVVGSRRVIMPNWEALNNAPEDLRAGLEELDRRLQESLRIAEVELSLERARLGREEMRLRVLEEQLQKESKRRGGPLASEELGKKLKSAEDPEQVKSQRWLRMLGMGKEGE